MLDVLDFELDKTDDERPQPGQRPETQRRRGGWIGAGLVVIAVAAAAYIWYARPDPSTTSTEVVVTQRPVAADRALGGEADRIEVPPLDQSDPLVRRLLSELSSHPRVAAWLATGNLIRNFTLVVENIAGGAGPAQHLRVLRPAGVFRTIGEDQFRVDPRSYDRYNSIADAVATLDAAGSARLYSTLKLRVEDAYRDLGHEGPFDVALERAVVQLLRTPIVDGDVQVVFKGALFGYADPALEQLTPAQKQLLRMGPRNVRIIQAKLREIALALGIAPTRLPAART
jgi:DUF3014 family protein